MTEAPDSYPPFSVRINGLESPALHYRISHQDPDDFDVLFDDDVLGPIAITADCVLEVREAGAEWRSLGLDELKDVLLKSRELFVGEDLPKASEMFEALLFTPLDRTDVEAEPKAPTRLADLTGHSECRKRVTALFYKNSIPYKGAGTVFTVPDSRQARNVLSDAGCYPSPYSASALIEPYSQCAVYLIEDPL